MKAIQVKYLGATNTKGSRIKAFIQGHSLTIGYHTVLYKINGNDEPESNLYKYVAEQLIKKLEWNNVEILGGGLLPNNEYAFILKPSK